MKSYNDALAYSKNRRKQLLDKFVEQTITMGEAREFKGILEKDRDKKDVDLKYFFGYSMMIYHLDRFLYERRLGRRKIMDISPAFR